MRGRGSFPQSAIYTIDIVTNYFFYANLMLYMRMAKGKSFAHVIRLMAKCWKKMDCNDEFSKQTNQTDQNQKNKNNEHRIIIMMIIIIIIAVAIKSRARAREREKQIQWIKHYILCTEKMSSKPKSNATANQMYDTCMQVKIKRNSY